MCHQDEVCFIVYQPSSYLLIIALALHYDMCCYDLSAAKLLHY